jgi:hypothetical protein
VGIPSASSSSSSDEADDDVAETIGATWIEQFGHEAHQAGVPGFEPWRAERLRQGLPFLTDAESEEADRETDDDAARVLRAFEQSLITTGKAKPNDRTIALELLARFTPEQIENGILLGAARRSTSAIDQPALRAKVHSLAYFVNAVEEAASCVDESYAWYLRHTLDRNRKAADAERLETPPKTET